MKTKFCFVFAIAAHVIMSLLCILMLADYVSGSIVGLIVSRTDVFLMTLYSACMLLFFSKFYMDYRYSKYKNFTIAILITYAVALLIYVLIPSTAIGVFLIGITYIISGFYMIYIVPSPIEDGYTFVTVYRTLFVLSTLGATISIMVYFYSSKLGNMGMLASSLLALFACMYYRNSYSK